MHAREGTHNAVLIVGLIAGLAGDRIFRAVGVGIQPAGVALARTDSLAAVRRGVEASTVAHWFSLPRHRASPGW